MKSNDDLILGVLFSSWLQSLVLEYKRKKSAFVLVEFNSPQRSDSPAHTHTKLLCCVNGVSSEGQSSKYLPVFVLRGGRFCTVRRNGSCTQIEISPACQCSVIGRQGEESKGKQWALTPCCGRPRFGVTTRKSDMLLFKLKRWCEGIGEVLGVRAGFYLIWHIPL